MKKRRHWAVSVNKRLASQARRLRSDGATFAAVCEELDVLEGSLRLWMEQYPEAEIREVALVPEIREAARSISMTTRNGLRFDGLELDAIIVLLEVRG
jgi:hypothetical protein